MPPYRDGASPGSKGGRERIRLFRVQPARGTLRSKTGAAVSKDVRRWSLVGLPFPAPPLSRSYRKFRHVIVSRYVEAGDALQAFDKYRPHADRDRRHRSEERRVGKECVSPCRSRWSPYN